MVLARPWESLPWMCRNLKHSVMIYNNHKEAVFRTAQMLMRHPHQPMRHRPLQGRAIVGRWCEPSLDMGEITAHQGSNRHQKTHPVSLGNASAAGEGEEIAQKTHPPPRQEIIAQKSRRKERRGKMCFLILFFHSPVIAMEANGHAPCFLVFFVSAGLGGHCFSGQI